MERAADNIASELDADTWLDEHGDVLFRYALVRVRDGSVAEDLLQETLLAAMTATDGFQGASSERTWLIGILRHKLLDFFRRTAREREFEKDWASAPDAGRQEFDEQGQWKVALGEWGSPEKSLAKAEFWRVFNSCIDALPEQLRTPFALRELETSHTVRPARVGGTGHRCGDQDAGYFEQKQPVGNALAGSAKDSKLPAGAVVRGELVT